MSYGTGRPLLTPVDLDGSVRGARLRRLGLGERAGMSFDSFDAFADRVAEVTAAPFSMVNFIDENRQFFAGLHTPAGTGSGFDLEPPPRAAAAAAFATSPGTTATVRTSSYGARHSCWRTSATTRGSRGTPSSTA